MKILTRLQSFATCHKMAQQSLFFRQVAYLSLSITIFCGGFSQKSMGLSIIAGQSFQMILYFYL